MSRQRSKKENMKIVGDAGEIAIMELLASQGYEIVPSIDKFDSIKDFTQDGLTAEVKTQVPWVKEKAFTFKPNQVNKIMQADIVYFLAIPNDRYPTEFDGCLFRFVRQDKPLPMRFKKVSDGREMFLVDWKDLEMIHRFTDKEFLAKLKAHSTSEYNNYVPK